MAADPNPKTDRSRPAVELDVAIIGAGYTGLLALYHIRQLGFSVRSLRRYCEKYAGLSPKQLVMSGRILRACTSLMDQRLVSISDVANSLGFGDQSAFTNAFRHYVGMTPARLRAEPIVHCERR